MFSEGSSGLSRTSCAAHRERLCVFFVTRFLLFQFVRDTRGTSPTLECEKVWPEWPVACRPPGERAGLSGLPTPVCDNMSQTAVPQVFVPGCLELVLNAE